MANREVYENPDKAIDIANNIINNTNNLEVKIDALILISTSYSSKRNYEESLKYASEAEKLLQETQDEKLKIKVFNKIGIQYQQLRIYDKAIDYLNNAITLINTQKSSSSLQKLIGYNYAVRGFIYREQMSCELALDYFNKAHSAYLKTLEDPVMNANISIVSYNKGNCFILTNKIDSAKYSFKESINFASKINAKSLKAFAQKGLAEVYTIEGKYKEAINILHTADSASTDVGDLVLNQGIYKGLSDNYLAIGDHCNYQFYNNKYSTIQQQIKTTESNTVNKSIKNSIDEKTKQINKLKQSSFVTQLIFIFIILTLLFIILQKQIKHKTNHKKLTTELHTLEKERNQYN